MMCCSCYILLQWWVQWWVQCLFYAFFWDYLLADVVQAMREAADHFVKPTDRKRLPTPELIDDLRSNGPRYVRKRTKFEDCDLDSLHSMYFYGLDNGFFKDHPSVGFELLATRLLKELQRHQNLGVSLPVWDGHGLDPTLHNPAQNSVSTPFIRIWLE